MLDILILIGTGILLLCLIYLGILPRLLNKRKEKVTLTTVEEEQYLKTRKIITYVIIGIASAMVLIPFLILYLPLLF